MYHSISDDPEPGRHPYYRTNASSAVFAQQMQWLADNGYKGLTLTAALESFHSHPGAKVVAITFDDGYQDFYAQAVPVMQRFAFTATMYLPTAFIADTRRRFKDACSGRTCLTWAEISQAHKAGFEFGAHTVTHPKLVELPWDTIEREIRECKAEIDARLGISTMAFAYPYAYPQQEREFTIKFQKLLQEVGYKSNATTRVARYQDSNDLFSLPRLPVNGCDDAALFAAKIKGAYDWFGTVQRWRKATKARSRSEMS